MRSEILNSCVIIGFTILTSSISFSQDPDSDVIVKTSLGSLRGLTRKYSTERHVRVFYKIPFAEPPIGQNRYKPPLPANPWESVLDCTRLGPACVQEKNPLVKHNPILKFALGLGNEEPSEDCLFLNIYTPTKFPDKLPVMVFIYGGAFIMGTANSQMYDGTVLAAEENVVVVTFNYRLSSFGFLYLGIDEAPGNQGLMDQAMALRWVQEHISDFGGDPNEVTIFGNSAGSASVAHHLLLPTSKSLFKRAILQSGVAHMPNGVEPRKSLLAAAKDIADNVGCPYNDTDKLSTLKCLLEKDATELMHSEPFHGYSYRLFFKPVVDGKYIVEHPLLALRKGTPLKRTPILIGNVQDESTIFLATFFPVQFPFVEKVRVDETDLREMLDELVGVTSQALITDTIFALYNNYYESAEYKRLLDMAIRVGNDVGFVCPSAELENAMVATNNTVYKYRFKLRNGRLPIPKWLGAFHGSEVQYVFGVPLRQQKPLNFTTDEIALSKRMMRYWANFARTGDPNMSPMEAAEEMADVPYWPPVSNKDGNYIVLDTNSTAIGIPSKLFCNFWGTIFPKMLDLEDNYIKRTTLARIDKDRLYT